MRALVIAIAAIALCATGTVRGADFPEFDEPMLKRGRAVWLGTCQACHANPLSDAPQAKDKAAWVPRIQKGRALFYQGALTGFTGPSGNEMPARGGNGSLSDNDVRAAVDYMIKLVTR